MLSNITVDGRTSLQTILLGQPQFRRMLADPAMEQLRQRVLTSYHLGPLSQDESRAYIEHRLLAVAWNGDPYWEDAAFDSVYHHTGGIPRRINRLASRILLYGVLEEVHTITSDIVDQTAIELTQDLDAGQESLPPLTPDLGLAGIPSDLATRVTALEQQMAQREQVFKRLTQMLGAR